MFGGIKTFYNIGRSHSMKNCIYERFKEVLYCPIFKLSSAAINISKVRSIRYIANSLKLLSKEQSPPFLHSYKKVNYPPTFEYWIL